MSAKKGGKARRQNMEDSPQATTRILGAVVRHSPLAVICTDTAGKVLMWNPAAERFFGWSEQEALGNLNPIVPPEKIGEFQGLQAQVQSGQPYVSRELERQRKDGSPIILNASSASLTDVDGNVIGLMGIFEDITERKQAEKELAEREVLLQQIMDTSNVGIGLVDMAGRFSHANRSMAEMFGSPLEEFLGSDYVDYVHPFEREIGRKNMLALLESEHQSVDLDRRYMRKDGTEFWGHLRCNRFYDAEGKNRGLIGVITDISERKQTEEKLRQSEARLNTILDNVGAYIFIKDRQYRYTYANRKTCRLFQKTPPEIAGKTDAAFFSVSSVEEIMLSDRPVIEEGKTAAREETDLTSPDGIPRTYWTVKLPLRDSAGAIIGLCGISTDITERKRAEELLRENEEKFTTVFRQAPLLTTISDIGTGRLIDVNDRFLEISGFTREEAIGRTVLELGWISEVQRARIRQTLREKGRVSDLELSLHRKDGGVVACLYSGEVITVNGQRLLLSMAQDITKRMEQEQALAESEASYRNLFESSTDGIFILDLKGNFIDVNRTAYERLGYTREEFLSLHIRELDHPSFASQVSDRLTQVQDQGVGVFESGHLRKDGSTMPVEVNCRLYEYKGEKAYFSVIRDITDRKKAENKLRQSEQFVRTILDTVDEGFIVIDRDYCIVTANKAYCGQAGLPSDKVVGRKCYEISHRASRPCYEDGEECVVLQVLATGEPQAAMHKHTDHAGHELYVETKGFPIKDPSGSVTSVIKTINNITEKHLLEKERLKIQKLESIGTLAGGIAHDFNNLLQGVFGYISLAKLNLDQRAQAESMLEQAEKALRQSVNLTTQLLTFSRGGKPVKKYLALGPVVEDAVKFALSGSRLEYRLDIDRKLCPVEADEGQIAQVIQNIVLNANQAMPRGGTIHIGARNVPAHHPLIPKVLEKADYVAVSIKDSGIGISEKILPRIFDPYFTTKDSGSGLGLATCYSIIKNHGGLIDVKSDAGLGSVFTIYLPAGGAEANEQTSMPDAEAIVHKRGKVLLMDDDETVRMVAGELIRSLGLEVDLAEDGRAAIRKYHETRESGQPYAVVILDLTVRGGMGGLETLRKLREVDPGLKAVVSSGYSDDEVIADHVSYGFQAFLKKPYDLKKLSAIFNAVNA